MARLDPPIDKNDVLAERRYAVTEGDIEKYIVIKIGFPIATPIGDFVCKAEIGDDCCRVVRPMRGRDAFEAMFVALIMIGTELTAFADVANYRFTWQNGQESGLKFPTRPDHSLRCIFQA